MTEEASSQSDKKKPSGSWVTRADTLAALALAVVFLVAVGIMLYRQHTAGRGIKVIQGEGGIVAYRINLNDAPAQELMLLPAIGEVRAGRLVAWRTEKGRFTSLDQVGEAAGISSKKLEELRPYVTLDSQE